MGQDTLLRHTLATLAYRAEKVLREVPPGFAESRAGSATRTPLQILTHMGDLMEWGERMARGEQRWQHVQCKDWGAAHRRFFAGLAAEFAAEPARIDAAYAAYREARDNPSLQALFDACEPRRQELFRRLNLASNGTFELVRMREDLLGLLRERPRVEAPRPAAQELGAIDADFAHLFGGIWHRAAGALEATAGAPAFARSVTVGKPGGGAAASSVCA